MFAGACRTWQQFLLTITTFIALISLTCPPVGTIEPVARLLVTQVDVVGEEVECDHISL